MESAECLEVRKTYEAHMQRPCSLIPGVELFYIYGNEGDSVGQEDVETPSQDSM